MAITVGTENVSDIQLTLLGECDVDTPPDVIASLLDEVLTDPDIRRGRETLHPDWISVFNRQKDQLQAFVRRPQFREFLHVVDSFSPLDPLLGTIDPKNEKVAFLLGAGASKPSPSSIPTVTELLPELLRLARRLDREQVTSLADFCDQQRIDNIEDLLTAVQISAFCSRNLAIMRLVEFQLFGRNNTMTRGGRPRLPARTDVSSVAYLQDTLQVLFGLLSNLMLPANPNDGHRAIVNYLRVKPSTPIITTNYDCCIDRALISNAVPFTYTVDFDNPHVLGNSAETAAPLIKLHGSLNWFYCETCQKVRLIDIEETVDSYNNQRGEYPIISVCNECGGQRRALLVPPHAMKFDIAPPLQSLIEKASSCFEQSTLIVVVGFSFADADLYISRMLIKAIQASKKTRLVIIDPDPGVTEKVRRKFNAQVPDFDSEARILRVLGDCSTILPQFLSGDLLRAASNGATERQLRREEKSHGV